MKFKMNTEKVIKVVSRYCKMWDSAKEYSFTESEKKLAIARFSMKHKTSTDFDSIRKIAPSLLKDAAKLYMKIRIRLDKNLYSEEEFVTARTNMHLDGIGTILSEFDNKS